MKKKLIIFRFGSERPTRKEWDIITTITDGTNRAIGFGTIFGVGSIVETSYTPKQITSLFTRVADDTRTSFPPLHRPMLTLTPCMETLHAPLA